MWKRHASEMIAEQNDFHSNINKSEGNTAENDVEWFVKCVKLENVVLLFL